MKLGTPAARCRTGSRSTRVGHSAAVWGAEWSRSMQPHGGMFPSAGITALRQTRMEPGHILRVVVMVRVRVVAKVMFRLVIC